MTNLQENFESTNVTIFPYMKWWSVNFTSVLFTIFGTLILFISNVFFWFGIPFLFELLLRYALYSSTISLCIYFLIIFKGRNLHTTNFKKLLFLSILMVPILLVFMDLVQDMDSFDDILYPCGENYVECRYKG